MIKLAGNWSIAAKPETIEEMSLPKGHTQTFLNVIKSKDMPNFSFESSCPGTGKTTVAEILVKSFRTSIMYFNGSMESGIDKIRTDVEQFLHLPSVASFEDDKPSADFKCVYVEEADKLTERFQEALRGLMNEHAEDARFIFTGNFSDRLLEAVKSRFVRVRFEYTRAELSEMCGTFTERACRILTDNGIKHDPDAVADIVSQSAPDFRLAWDSLQRVWLSRGSIDTADVTFERDVDQIVVAMKSKNFGEVLRAVTNSGVDLRTIYSHLFRRLPEFKGTFDIPMIAYLMGDWSRLQGPDSVVNFMAYYADLLIRDKGQK
jgi:DNA polymerase III delta prime subunit